MYYCIFDPPVGPKEYERAALIKKRLTELGVAGEMANPMPGKTIADLVENALKKRYSTIVAVGNVPLINEVARCIEPHDLVLGIVPLTPHPDLGHLIGTDTWEAAAEQLKRRLWQYVYLGELNRNHCFLTPAHLSLPHRSPTYIASPRFALQVTGGELTITPVRTVEAEPESDNFILEITYPTEARRGFLSGLFQKSSTAVRESRLTIPEATIETTPPAPVVVAGTEVTQTPLHCRVHKHPIRLIVARTTPT